MKRSIVKLSLGMALLAVAYSCSKDDGNTPDPQAATCDDGIQNGDETGVEHVEEEIPDLIGVDVVRQGLVVGLWPC